MKTLTKTVLVAGAQGVIGRAAAEHFSKEADTTVYAVSRRPVVGLENVHPISADLLDPADTRTKLEALKDVTQVVFGAYVALSGWLPKYYIDTYGMTLRTAALLTASFIFPASLLRPLGIHAYGFEPYALTKEENRRIHGDDERISLENVRRGAEILYEIVRETAAKGDAPGAHLQSARLGTSRWEL